MRLYFTVPGIPQPKERPRKGKGGHFYTPRSTGRFEADLRVYALAAIRRSGWPLATDKRVAVWLWAYFPDERRRDLDNVAKCLDGGNGILWHDDSQIHELHVYKRYDREKPRLEVTVEISVDRVSDKP